MSTSLNALEISRMIVMTILSVCALGHLVYLIYLYAEIYTAYVEYLNVDSAIIIVAGSLYLAGLISSIFPRTGIGKSTGFKIFVHVAFVVDIFLLVRGIVMYRKFDGSWVPCDTFHICLKDLFITYVPVLIYDIFLLLFIYIDACSNHVEPKQDQRSLPIIYNNNESNR